MDLVALPFLGFLSGLTLLFYVVPTAWRWRTVWICGMGFLAWISPWSAIALLAFTIINHGMMIRIMGARSDRQRATFWWLSNAINVAGWVGIKYTGIATAGATIGFSFYLLQCIALNSDAFFGRLPKRPSLFETAFYLGFIVKLSAGPVERFEHLMSQLPLVSGFRYDRIQSGGRMILFGLFKKVFVSGHLNLLIAPIFEQNEQNALSMSLGALFYGFMVYLDVSAYTDIARGAGRLFGLELSPNFNRPFAARSVADFWRRWHMSVSGWVEHYVFQPLHLWLGVRAGLGRYAAVPALIISFLVIGAWHGTHKTYLLFGVLHGSILVLEMLTRSVRAAWTHKYVWFGHLGWASTLVVYSLSSLLFRTTGIADYKLWMSAFHPENILQWPAWEVPWTGMALILCFIWAEHRFIRDSISDWLGSWPAWVRWLFYAAAIYAILALSPTHMQTFIYSAI